MVVSLPGSRRSARSKVFSAFKWRQGQGQCYDARGRCVRILHMQSYIGFGNATQTLAALVAATTILVAPTSARSEPVNALHGDAYSSQAGVVPVQFKTPDDR